jgi:hypothetical protein
VSSCHPPWLDIEIVGTGAPVAIVITCQHCGDYVSLGPARETTRRETRLASHLACIHRLWEPGRERNEIVEAVVFACAVVRR